MAFPYIVSEVIWNAKDVNETKYPKSEFEACQAIVVEVTTAGFSGTLDIQGTVHEISAYANVPYVRQDQATLQTPAVAQLSYTTNTGVVRYLILGYWRRLKLVMTRTAGTITLAVVGSSNAILFPRIIQT
jgi:hypothetical protein